MPYLVSLQHRAWFSPFLIVRMVRCGMAHCERGPDDAAWTERVNEAPHLRTLPALLCWEQGSLGEAGVPQRAEKNGLQETIARRRATIDSES